MSSFKWWVLGGVIVAAGAGVAWWKLVPAKAPAPQFITAPVDHGSVVGRVTATGTASALVTVSVGAQVSGRIAQLFVDYNSQVKKGEVLLKLDPSLIEASLAMARANEQAGAGQLEGAKAQEADALRKLNREKQLAEQKLVAQADLDSAQAAYDIAAASVLAAKGSLAQAAAQRHQAEVNLTYATVTSPIDGTVISRAVDVGQTVAASLQAPTLFTIAENLTRMQVDTNVAEADVGRLVQGGDATFSVDAFPGRTFKGTIRQIRYAAQIVSNVVTYDAVIDVQNPDLLLRPGMTANVTFVYARADDTLRVPNAALRFRYDSGEPRKWGGADGGTGGPREGSLKAAGVDGAPERKAVWVLRDGKPERVRLEVGLTDGSYTQVKGGELAEGDQVIVDKADGSSARPASGMGPPGGGMGPPPAAGGGMRRMF
jgi:HlyD family secretion protein